MRRVFVRLVAAAAVAVAVSGSTGPPATAVEAPDVQSVAYDLGERLYAEPYEGELARMPVRLWGAIAAPVGPGPYPVVIIGHGAHGDGCPDVDDVSTWPCWDVVRRNDLGFGWLARALAQRGVVAVAPDLNSAYTGGWGELGSREYARFARVYDETLAALARADAGQQEFPIDLTGRVDLTRIGVVGHSRGGFNSVRWAARNPEVSSLFLLAPYWGPRALPDIPTAVTVGSCDGDTGRTGLRYARRAVTAGARTTVLYTFTVAGANHNFYNRTLVRLGSDDNTGSPGCTRAERATPRQQQRWLARVAGAHIAATLTTPRETAGFLRRSGPVRIAGLATEVQRYRPQR